MFVHDKEQIIVGPVRTGKWHALAEAIREGCKKLPRQVFGNMYEKKDGACVLGAAYSTGIRLPEMISVECPHCGNPPFDYDAMGVNLPAHLNDFHRWTREAIADWLDTL